jgi:imidazolonepropionase-like amidohydrolase
MHAIRATSAFDGTRFLDGGATVLVDGERIAGVEGPDHDLPAGTDVTTYDGTLLPGLVDAHVHLVADASLGGLERVASLSDDEVDAVIAASLDRQAAAGVTTVRDLGDRGYRTLAFRDRSSPGVPRVVCAGPPLTVPAGHCHYLGGAVAGDDAVAAAVRERVERGVDVVKVMASGGMLTAGTDVMGVQFTPAELSLVVRHAHEAGLPVVAHAHSLAGAWHALEAGVDGIEHFTCLTESGVRTPDDLLVRLAAGSVVVDPTLGTDVAKVPPVELAPPQIRELATRFGLVAQEFFRNQAARMAQLRAHGVVVVTGTDAGIGPMKDHGSTWRAVLQLTDGGGHDLAEALASATSVSARVCGVDDRTGRLAAGLAADLLVVDGDLREDPDALGRPAAVWVRGTRVV